MKKKRALVFGTGNNFIFSCSAIEEKYVIIGLADNSESKCGKNFFGYTVKKLEAYGIDQFDYVIITPNIFDGVVEQFIDMGVDTRRIITLGEALNNDYLSSEVHISVLLYGGMGDFIIAKDWLYHLDKKTNLFSEHIDLYCKSNDVDTVESIFSDCDWLKDIRVIEYNTSTLVDNDSDLVIWFSIFPKVQYLRDEKVFEKNQELYSYADELRRFGLGHYLPGFFSSPEFYKTVYSIFNSYSERKYHTHYDVLGNLAADDKYMCSIPIGIGDDYLSDIGLEAKHFITIDTGLNIEYASKPNVRAWKYDYWNELARCIKAKYPQFKTVQIGLAAGICEDICVDVNLNGKTNLEQVKVLMKYSLLHIDYEGGLVHLRHALGGGASIVLMGPTSSKIHNYPENIPVSAEVCAVPCEWTSQDWLVKCKLGYKYPKCMEIITPEMVMNSIDEFMRRID